MTQKRVLIAAGGTGGHLFPAQQLAEMLKGDAEILFAGHQIGANPFFEREKIPFAEISAHPLKKGFFSAACLGFWQGCKLIFRFAPEVVVGFGSYHTFPILLAAAIMRKKIILFEANCLLGKVNRFFRPVAAHIAFQFPVLTKRGVLVPWLPWKNSGSPVEPLDAKKFYGLDPQRKTILVFGGSQGASFLNMTAPKAIKQMREKCQVIHLTGPAEVEAVRSAYEQLGIDAAVKPFEKEMVQAYAAADLALCRSGAGTIAELIRFELPALLVPYPFASDNHQKKNGEYLRDALGAARLVDQGEANAERLAHELDALMVEREEKRLRLRAAHFDNLQRIHLADLLRRYL